MAAELQEWVDGGGDLTKSKGAPLEPLVVTVGASSAAADSGAGSSSGTTGSVGTGEPALSVISDTLSEEYSSDSGKGGSDTTVTPPDSINGGADAVTADYVPGVGTTAWNLLHGYSTYTAYSKSLGSVMPNHAMIYEFEIPQAIVGKLIGRYGCFVSKIKFTTGANIIVKRHQHTKTTKICAVEGVCAEIDQALLLIRDRFPVKRYPHVTLEQVNLQHEVIPVSNISFIPNNRLNLIEGVVNDVCISCVTDLDHIFVQHPTHPTYPALARLHDCMKALYEQPNAAPLLVKPFNPGVICITKIGAEDWVRAEVIALSEEKEVATARLVDVGGYVQVPFDNLRQIRADFVTIPFQATECRLANVGPLNEKEGWTEEAANFFKIMSQGQVLQAQVVGYCGATGSTLITLYKPTGHSNHLCINEEMVTHNYAQWIDELDPQYFYTSDSVAAYSNEINQLSHNLGEWVTLSPDLMTVVPTEYCNSNASAVTLDGADAAADVDASSSTTSTTTLVPELNDTQDASSVQESSPSSAVATDNAISDSNSAIPAVIVTEAEANTSTLSWADEMTAAEEWYAKNKDLTEKQDMTPAPKKAGKGRRKKGKM